MSEAIAGLKLMRKPFEPNQISKMCRPTKKDNPPGKCNFCGGWHKLPAVQLNYVGHAALTDRLLDADPNWTWEPLSYAPNGTPFLDSDGGLWIKLTVAGVTRLGYGDAQGKQGGDAMKERIGDALRNAAMRFGAALDLWHKGDLHADEGETFQKQEDGTFAKTQPARTENVQPVVTVSKGAPPAASPAPWKAATAEPKKPVARKTKEPVPDTGKPWGGAFEPKPKAADFPFGENSPPVPQAQSVNQPAVPAPNIHGVVIEDSEIPFPGDDKPQNLQEGRLPTDAEAKNFRERLIKVKDKGYGGLGQWIIKTSGKPRTQDIPYTEINRMVEQVEAAEKAGKLKELLEAK